MRREHVEGFAAAVVLFLLAIAGHPAFNSAPPPNWAWSAGGGGNAGVRSGGGGGAVHEDYATACAFDTRRHMTVCMAGDIEDATFTRYAWQGQSGGYVGGIAWETYPGGGSGGGTGGSLPAGESLP